MDTLTHALLGGLAVRASLPRTDRFTAVPSGTATWIGVLVAAFPDIDYLSFWIDPLRFLAEWHRGPTHSLLMAPLWALLLGTFFTLLLHRPRAWLYLVGICLLALASHIASDLITAYGTQILWPLSDIRLAFGTTFVIDPWFSALVGGGLLVSLRLSRPATGARIGLLALAGYLGLQLILQQQTKSLGEAFAHKQGLTSSSVHALPQPFSPFNWSIIVSDGQSHHVGLVNLAYSPGSVRLAENMGWPRRLWAAYQPADDLLWESHDRYGKSPEQQALAQEVWQQATFARFRHFAQFPVLYRIDRHVEEVCVWYTDLRYVLPGLIPPFRYGMCGTGTGTGWQLYRLRRFTHGERHSLGDADAKEVQQRSQ